MHIDYTRQPCAKERTLSRRKERRAKSARLFLAWAFPADAFNDAARG